jgi:hypothetical protein
MLEKRIRVIVLEAGTIESKTTGLSSSNNADHAGRTIDNVNLLSQHLVAESGFQSTWAQRGSNTIKSVRSRAWNAADLLWDLVLAVSNGNALEIDLDDEMTNGTKANIQIMRSLNSFTQPEHQEQDSILKLLDSFAAIDVTALHR